VASPTKHPLALTFFNNKGGVGKTTLSCNIASILARTHNLKVLYVDCDPQCNATQLLLNDEVWLAIFSRRRDSSKKTILHTLRQIRAGDSTINTDYHVERSTRFGIDVLAGHPSLAVVEDKFSSSWVEFKGGEDIGAARRTMWARTLVSRSDYDLVVFDIGPSLGPLNRTVLLASDFFVTPMSADLFSLYALENIHEWMSSWIATYERAVKQIRPLLSVEIMGFAVPDRLPIASGYAGYTVQQYVTRSALGEVRQVRAYDKYRNQIPNRVKALRAWAAPEAANPDLGVVPNMFAMVPLAQSVHSPIDQLRTADGLRGAQISQNAKYAAQLTEIASALGKNLGLASRAGKSTLKSGSRKKHAP